MSTAIGALRHNDVNTAFLEAEGVLDCPSNGHDFHAAGVRLFHQKSGITEPGDIDRHLLIQHDLNLLVKEVLGKGHAATGAGFSRSRVRHVVAFFEALSEVDM